MRGLPPGARLPQVGLIVTIDMSLGRAGELEEMHTALFSIGLGVPKHVAERIGAKVQRVIEAELFEEAPVIEVKASRA